MTTIYYWECTPHIKPINSIHKLYDDHPTQMFFLDFLCGLFLGWGRGTEVGTEVCVVGGGGWMISIYTLLELLAVFLWLQPVRNNRFTVCTFMTHYIQIQHQSWCLSTYLLLWLWQPAAGMTFLHNLYLESGSLCRAQRSSKSQMWWGTNQQLLSNRQFSQWLMVLI